MARRIDDGYRVAFLVIAAMSATGGLIANTIRSLEWADEREVS